MPVEDSISRDFSALISRRMAASFIWLDLQGRRMEGEMKQAQGSATGAPWTDRTSLARQGLWGKARRYGRWNIRLTLSHTMDYGKWLEIACKKGDQRGTDGPGPYAILLPTLSRHWIEINTGVVKIWDRPFNA